LSVPPEPDHSALPHVARVCAGVAEVVVWYEFFRVKLPFCVLRGNAAIPERRSEESMSKSSTVTERETPVTDVSTVTAGNLTIHGETIVVQTQERIELVDLTERIIQLVRRLRIREGLVSLWSLHTTCALFINEFQLALLSDIKRFLEEVVARDGEWMHNDPNHSDCDRMNADSHLRALLLGHSLTLQVSGGEPVLGQWQRVLLGELDGPRARVLRVQVWGIA
jgi:secondary thiamine-phosphate synthase enzyme